MATRIHFRYVVTDRAGNVIQNAAVNVFQPGTGTSFTGSAFTAKTGGTTLTNPFISNNQGEVEAWFDTPQSFDINVTSNSGQAYYPATPGSLLAFSAFTEANYDLEAAREDSPVSIGLVGDITSVDVADAGVAGATSRWADAAHQHAFQRFLAHRTTQLSLTASAAETSVLAGVVPAGGFVVGATYIVYAAGEVDKPSDATPTAQTFRTRVGAAALGGTVVHAPTIATQTSVAESNKGWTYTGYIVCRSTGATGTIVSTGVFEHEAGAAIGLANQDILAPAATTTVDTTVDRTIEMSVQNGEATAGYTWRCEVAFIERIA